MGAIRARPNCFTCHDVKENDLLGAFTYTLAYKSAATDPSLRLADLASLSSDVLAAIQTIEAIGGSVKRDSAKPGHPVTEVDLESHGH